MEKSSKCTMCYGTGKLHTGETCHKCNGYNHNATNISDAVYIPVEKLLENNVKKLEAIERFRHDGGKESEVIEEFEKLFTRKELAIMLLIECRMNEMHAEREKITEQVTDTIKSKILEVMKRREQAEKKQKDNQSPVIYMGKGGEA